MGKRREVNADNGEALGFAAVAENRDGELRARQVCLDQHGLVVTLEQVRHALPQRRGGVA